MSRWHKLVSTALGLAFCLVAASAQGGNRPAATLADEIKALELKLVDGYAAKHPRLLFGAKDKSALQAKAKDCPELWSRVIASAKRLGNKAPDAEEVKTGAHYWRIERVQSGALAYFVTGNKTHMDRAVRWMVQYCKGPVWGTGWGSNVDLHASWYLYHISMAYDTLYDELSAADRKIIRDGLADHARAIYNSLNPADPKFRYKSGFRYDQNHTYIPAVALATASLALLEDVPEAKQWLKHACAIMQRCRYALGEDGYYYEGTGYWSYALHWHVRYAELISRATGQKAHELPILRHNWLFPLHLGLPGSPYMFDIGDVGRGFKDGKRNDARTNSHSMFWSLAAALKSPESRLVGDMLDAKWPDNDYPAIAFLRFDPSIKPAKLDDIKPYHHFADHGFVCWRSGWDKDATVLVFRCGPPAGHKALAKLGQMKDWVMNCGHTHPDIGAFWLYAKGAYLATGTGYTAKKYTRDHNTLTIGDVGQGMDGTYHNERGYPYERFNQCRILKAEMDEKGALVSGEFGAAYPKGKVGDVKLRRTVRATKDFLVVVDDFNTTSKPHAPTWYCHADAEFKPEGDAFVARLANAGLAVIPVDQQKTTSHPEKTIVAAGTGPGKATPEHRGWQLRRVPTDLVKPMRLVHVLVPLDKDSKPPTVMQKSTPADRVVLVITWPNGKQENVRLDLAK